ncbi:MAG: hypothetical protein AAFV69_13650 [Pseudomonadota bacterium]
MQLSPAVIPKGFRPRSVMHCTGGASEKLFGTHRAEGWGVEVYGDGPRKQVTIRMAGPGL